MGWLDVCDCMLEPESSPPLEVVVRVALIARCMIDDVSTKYGTNEGVRLRV